MGAAGKHGSVWSRWQKNGPFLLPRHARTHTNGSVLVTGRIILPLCWGLVRQISKDEVSRNIFHSDLLLDDCSVDENLNEMVIGWTLKAPTFAVVVDSLFSWTPSIQQRRPPGLNALFVLLLRKGHRDGDGVLPGQRRSNFHPGVLRHFPNSLFSKEPSKWMYTFW